MIRPRELQLPSGIWRHNKIGRQYGVWGIGSLKQEADNHRSLIPFGSARFSEEPEIPVLVFHVTGAIRPGGQWVVDSMWVPLDGIGPQDSLVVYTDLQNIYLDEPHVWVRPLYGPAGWLTSPETTFGKRNERFTFVMAAAPWPL